MGEHPASADQVTLVGVGAMMPEVLAAASQLSELGVTAGVVCLSSPDLIFRACQARSSFSEESSSILEVLFPSRHNAPLVTVVDGHPHTLAFLAGVRGDRGINLGVSEFGQSSSLEDAYKIHGIDSAAIVRAALNLLGK
jgi:pyruvate dehydrogenase E1 component